MLRRGTALGEGLLSWSFHLKKISKKFQIISIFKLNDRFAETVIYQRDRLWNS